MKHISLESGIGGFDYAAEMMGWENVAHCEINEFCQQTLKYYWPNAKSYTDIFTMDGRPYRGLIDIITCGFPCQPFSLAGKGAGDKDDRFIWPENMRIVREVQPGYVVAENVPGLLNKHPLVFERVCTDLENEGYTVIPINIPACATEKDHERQRWFFVAYNHRYGYRNINGLGKNSSSEGEDKSNGYKRERPGIKSRRSDQDYSNLVCLGEEQSQQEVTRVRNEYPGCARDNYNPGLAIRQSERRNDEPQLSPFERAIRNESWLEAATRLCRVDDGSAGGLDTQAISKAKWYRESIRGYGNAIVWEIAYQIFKAIESYHTNHQIIQ